MRFSPDATFVTSQSCTVSNFMTSSTKRPSSPSFFAIAGGRGGAPATGSGTMPGLAVMSSAS